MSSVPAPDGTTVGASAEREAARMWHDMMTIEIPVVEKILRTVLVYAVIIVLFRLSGKRGLASMNTFDFVVVFLLSNVVQNAIIGSDYSLLGGVVGAATLVAVNALMNRWLAADTRAAKLLEGDPTTVIEDGRVVRRAMRRLGLRSGELQQAVRLQTGGSIETVERGSLEPDGRFVIVPDPQAAQSTRADIDRLETRLAAIEELLRAKGREQSDKG
ncbi:DUF421 domain-containing protein [Streptomyces tubbatahanensis]|uniref:DUF421 domain-containing protein n=1 Tax=Streptomyces tubbatahanensis TaxID=2923272 RepID=A0ABY3XSN8_9ACTN|nr:YetF domain-containing protein [Streptomyces tubbatahanensis]UNS97444.1 DUF421 domain-containing protein [Streptomyces tubbatahanensis]